MIWVSPQFASNLGPYPLGEAIGWCWVSWSLPLLSIVSCALKARPRTWFLCSLFSSPAQMSWCLLWACERRPAPAHLTSNADWPPHNWKAGSWCLSHNTRTHAILCNLLIDLRAQLKFRLCGFNYFVEQRCLYLLMGFLIIVGYYFVESTDCFPQLGIKMVFDIIFWSALYDEYRPGRCCDMIDHLLPTSLWIENNARFY